MENNTEIKQALKEYEEKLTKESRDLLTDMNYVKYYMSSLMDTNKFIDNARKVIKSSKDFSFKNNRAEKFIDVKRPTFLLSIKNKKLLTSLEGIDKVNDKLDILVPHVQPLLSEISKFLLDICLKDEKLRSIKDINFILSNVYIIKVTEDNTVLIQYFI